LTVSLASLLAAFAAASSASAALSRLLNSHSRYITSPTTAASSTMQVSATTQAGVLSTGWMNTVDPTIATEATQHEMITVRRRSRSRYGRTMATARIGTTGAATAAPGTSSP
jgi:hypothetical protein